MADRRFNQFPATLEHRVVTLDGYVQLNADGSVATAGSVFRGGAVARVSAGLYSVTLEDHYPTFLSGSVQLVSATSQALRCDLVQVQTDNLSGKTVSGGTFVHSVSNVNQVQFKIVNATTGVPTDVSQVCGVCIMLVMRNSSV